MDGVKIAEFEEQIRGHRQEILSGIRQHLHQSDDPATMALANHMEEVDDWVEADMLNEIDVAQLRHEVDQLRSIDAALSRIKSGSYGMCTSCGEAIALERMVANPTAQTCIACQEELEKWQVNAAKHSI